MRSVVDRNVFMRHIPVFVYISTESINFPYLTAVDEVLLSPNFERTLNCVSMPLYVTGLYWRASFGRMLSFIAFSLSNNCLSKSLRLPFLICSDLLHCAETFIVFVLLRTV